MTAPFAPFPFLKGFPVGKSAPGGKSVPGGKPARTSTTGGHGGKGSRVAHAQGRTAGERMAGSIISEPPLSRDMISTDLISSDKISSDMTSGPAAGIGQSDRVQRSQPATITDAPSLSGPSGLSGVAALDRAGLNAITALARSAGASFGATPIGSTPILERARADGLPGQRLFPGFPFHGFQGLRLPGARLAPLDPLAPTLGRLGNLEVRLARTKAEIRKAQALRYRVFYEEMSAIADAMTLATRRDADAFDAICDHMLVLDHDAPAKPFRRKKPRIVGTYRLLRQDVADQHGGFYTASEYDIAPILAAHPDLKFLELGRSCVLEPYRTKRTVELLWHGVWAYILRHGLDAMIGVASLEGTNPDKLAMPLSFLHHNCRAPDGWRARALDRRYVEMNRMAKEAIDTRAALHALPPLIKGYLRLGAFVGEGAVVDHQFGTTDVLIVLPVGGISSRYINYYGADASRYAS